MEFLCVPSPLLLLVSWSSGNSFQLRLESYVSGRFEVQSLSSSNRTQCRQRLATDSPPLQDFVEKSCVARRGNDEKMAPSTFYTFWRNTTSKIAYLILKVTSALALLSGVRTVLRLGFIERSASSVCIAN